MPRKPRTPKTEQRAPEVTVPLAVVGRGGRKTRDAAGTLGLFGAMTLIPPKDPAGDWRSLNLDSRTLSRISAHQLAEYLIDLSPEVSKAVFDTLRECNPGYELKAYAPGSDGKTVDERATAALDDFRARLDASSDGMFDVKIGRLFLSLFLRGALVPELVLDDAGRLPLDIVTPDPYLFRFRRAPAPELGEKATKHVLCQWQDGKLVDLDVPTVRYVPIDPLPGSPYGRPLVAPALFVCLFMLAVMHDLRRVVQNQAYPRHWVQISIDEVIKAAPQLASSWQALNAEVQKAADQTASSMETLEPDHTFITSSMVNLKDPIGAGGADKLTGITAIIEWLERLAVKALKSTPFQMGLNQSTTETMANRQYESHMLGIRTLQHYVETPLSRLFTLALQAQGIVADAKLRFEVNRASERMRDAQTEQVEIDNAVKRYQAGWISQDEAAKAGADKDVADVPEPRSGGAPSAPDPSTQENPEPGTNRGQRVRAYDRRASKLVPLGAEEPFGDLVPLDELSDDDKAALAGVWDRSQPRRYRNLLVAEVVNGSSDGESE